MVRFGVDQVMLATESKREKERRWKEEHRERKKRLKAKERKAESDAESEAEEQYGSDEYTMLISMLQEFKVLVRHNWETPNEAFDHINRNSTGEISKGDLKIIINDLGMVLDKRSRHFIRNQIGKPCTRSVWAAFFTGGDEAYEMNNHAERVVKRASIGQPKQPKQAARAPKGPVACKSKFRKSMYEAPSEKDGYMEKKGHNGKYGMRFFIITGHYLTYYAVRYPFRS